MVTPETNLRIPAFLMPYYLRYTSTDEGKTADKRVRVNCGICKETRYYSIHRGVTKIAATIIACEACRHYYQKFKRQPSILRCKTDGECYVLGDNSKSRCKACWIAYLIRRVPFPEDIYLHLLSHLPQKIKDKLPPLPPKPEEIPDDQLGSLGLEVYHEKQWCDIKAIIPEIPDTEPEKKPEKKPVVKVKLEPGIKEEPKEEEVVVKDEVVVKEEPEEQEGDAPDTTAFIEAPEDTQDTYDDFVSEVSNISNVSVPVSDVSVPVSNVSIPVTDVSVAVPVPDISNVSSIPVSVPVAVTMSQGTPIQNQIIVKALPLHTQGQTIKIEPLYSQGAPLNTQGAPLNTQGAPLNTQGAPIKIEPLHSQGAPLHTQGAPLNTQGAPLNTQGAPIKIESLQSQGAPIHSQVLPLDSQGAPLNSQVISINSQGVPLNSQVLPLNSQVTPLNSQGVPVNSQVIPLKIEHTENNPLNSQVTPLKIVHTDNIPLNSQVLPLNSQVIPLKIEHTDNIPLNSQVTTLQSNPVHSQVTPMKSEPLYSQVTQVTPIQSQVTTLHTENNPVHSQVTPVKSEPIYSQITPLHSQVLPLNSQVTPLQSVPLHTENDICMDGIKIEPNSLQWWMDDSASSSSGLTPLSTSGFTPFTSSGLTPLTLSSSSGLTSLTPLTPLQPQIPRSTAALSPLQPSGALTTLSPLQPSGALTTLTPLQPQAPQTHQNGFQNGDPNNVTLKQEYDSWQDSESEEAKLFGKISVKREFINVPTTQQNNINNSPYFSHLNMHNNLDLNILAQNINHGLGGGRGQILNVGGGLGCPVSLPVIAANPILANAEPAKPKKRRRKPKANTEENGADGIKKSPGDKRSATEMAADGTTLPSPTKQRKKLDRFNGVPEEEVAKKKLPDHLAQNLDIIIIGINPGLCAAHRGHHYAGPGNHFWKCMYLSGLIPEPFTADDDFRLLNYGIGFTNIVERTTRGSADLSKTEIKEGAKLLAVKMKTYKPLIAVFNGKGIYEIYSGKKEFCFGRQPENIEGTNTHIWVMPSSSARCAQLPRALDKVPFYSALKKYRDFLKGHITHLDDAEVVFTNVKLSNVRSPKNEAAKTEKLEPKAELTGQKPKGARSRAAPKAVDSRPIPQTPQRPIFKAEQRPMLKIEPNPELATDSRVGKLKGVKAANPRPIILKADPRAIPKAPVMLKPDPQRPIILKNEPSERNPELATDSRAGKWKGGKMPELRVELRAIEPKAELVEGVGGVGGVGGRKVSQRIKKSPRKRR